MPIPEHGNNAVVLKALGCHNLLPFASYYGNPIGFYGELAQAIPVETLIKRLGDLVQHEVLHCPGTPTEVKRIGIVTGGGQSSLLEAAELGCDVFISGEASEQTWHEARRERLPLFSGRPPRHRIHRHPSTGAILAEKYGIEHTAIGDCKSDLGHSNHAHNRPYCTFFGSTAAGGSFHRCWRIRCLSPTGTSEPRWI